MIWFISILKIPFICWQLHILHLSTYYISGIVAAWWIFLEWVSVWSAQVYHVCPSSCISYLCWGTLVHLCVETTRRTIQNEILTYVEEEVPNNLLYVNIFWRSLVNHIKYAILSHKILRVIGTGNEFLPPLDHFFIFLSRFSNILPQLCFLSCLQSSTVK